MRQTFAVMDSDHLCLATWRMAQLAKKAPLHLKSQAKAHARRLVRTYVMGRFIEQASILTPR